MRQIQDLERHVLTIFLCSLSNGAAVSITGQWMKSIGAKQAFELHAQHVQLLGSNDAKVCASSVVG